MVQPMNNTRVGEKCGASIVRFLCNMGCNASLGCIPEAQRSFCSLGGPGCRTRTKSEECLAIVANSPKNFLRKQTLNDFTKGLKSSACSAKLQKTTI